MISFFIKYMLVAIAGSSIVYFVSPMLAHSLKRGGQDINDVVLAYSEKVTANAPETLQEESRIILEADTLDNEPSDNEKPKFIPTPLKQTSDNVHQWGVVKTDDTPVFNRAGQLLRRMSAGTLLEVTGNQKAKNEQLLICNIEYEGALVTNVLIREFNAQLKSGNYQAASDDEKQLMSQIGQIVAKMAVLKRNKIANDQSNNPYIKEYLSVKEESSMFWAKVNDLTKKRDNSTGDDFVRYSDELRLLKGDDIRLAASLEKAKKNYLAWQSSHPQTEDPAIRNLREQLDLTVTKLKNIDTKDK